MIDGCAIGVSTGAFVLGRVLYTSKSGPSLEEVERLNRDNVFVIDRFLMADYSRTIGDVSDIAKNISVSLPALLVGISLWQYYGIKKSFSGSSTNSDGSYSAGIGNPEEALLGRLTEIIVMYYESLMLALGIKDSLKGLITRFRPYAYGSVVSTNEIVSDPDSTCSFPSGHTTAAFVGAVFFSTVFNDYYPDSPLRFPIWVGSLAIASATGALRVASGNHFLSDVVVGAIIGTVSVIGVRYLHMSIKL